MKIKLDQIYPDPEQPRKTFNEKTINELQSSFGNLGLIQPITIKPTSDSKYMIIVGERRFTAAKQRGDTKIECIVRKDVDDKAVREMQFAENTQQESVPPLELAQAFQKHKEKYGLTTRALSKVVGLSEDYITNLLSLVFAAKTTQQYLQSGELDASTAYEISTIKDEVQQTEVAQIVAGNELHRDTARKVIQIAKSQPHKLDELKDIAKTPNGIREQSLDAILTEINKKTIEKVEPMAQALTDLNIDLNTPEGKKKAAQILNKQASQEEKAQLTPTEVAQSKAEGEAKRQERETKAKEKAEKMSLEEINAIADKVVETDPGRAYHLKERLGKRLNRTERQNRQRQGIEVVSLPEGKYRAIVIDPPWEIDKIAREERLNQYDFDYVTMTLDEIMSLPVPDLASEDGCHIYLWTTHKHLPDALDILDAWGAKYQCLLTWVKNVGFTPFSFMYSTEHCLFARIGDLSLLKMGERLDFFAKVREHSRKPEEFYNLVRIVSPERRIDMFGREKHDGFDVWGNEPDKFKPNILVETK